jgi:AraC-like DNA-binding protein
MRVNLAELPMPIVSLDALGGDLTVPCVGTDPVQVARLAAEHLLIGGCTTLATVGNIERAFSQKLSAAVAACANEAGVPFHRKDMSRQWHSSLNPTEQTRRSDVDLAAWLADLPARSGIVAWSDSCALAIHGLIPAVDFRSGRLSLVAGSDDERLQTCDPPVSAIAHDADRIAARAIELARMLVARRAGVAALHTLAPRGLRIRASSRPTELVDPKIAQLIDLMRGDMPCLRPISALAEEVGLPRRRLERHFRATTGMSPHAYRQQVRREAARRLLDAGEDLATVARRCGIERPGRLRNLLEHGSTSRSADR